MKTPVTVGFDSSNDPGPKSVVRDADADDVAFCYSSSDADEIARRINTHDALVAALERIATEKHRVTRELRDIATSALTAARGE